MAKKSQGKAFFELLAEERRKRQEKAEGEAKPTPIVRRSGEAAKAPAGPSAAPPGPGAASAWRGPAAPPPPAATKAAPAAAPAKAAPAAAPAPASVPVNAASAAAPAAAKAPQVQAPPPLSARVPAAPALVPSKPTGQTAGPAWASRFSYGRVTLTYFQVALALVIVMWLCAMCFIVGRWLGGRNRLPLPNTPVRPTFEEIKGTRPSGTLLEEGQDRTPGGAPRTGGTTTGGPTTAGGGTPPAGGPAKPAGTPATAGTAPAPSPPAPQAKWRVRVARLAITNPEYTEKLRAYLEQNGVETELELRDQWYFLYTKTRFPSDRESNAFAQKVNELQRRFGAQTGWNVSADAFSVRAD
jgi:hypothetical protein